MFNQNNRGNPLYGYQQPQPQPQPTDLLGILQGNPQRTQAAMAQMGQNPAQILRQLGFNIPGNLSTPDQIGPYLLQSGQISQDTINRLLAINPGYQKLFSK